MVTNCLIEDGNDEYPDCIAENLGPQFSACNKQTLQSLKIMAILVCGRNLPNFFVHDASRGIHYHNIPINDSLLQDLSPYIPCIMRFLDEFMVHRRERVLVHCT